VGEIAVAFLDLCPPKRTTNLVPNCLIIVFYCFVFKFFNYPCLQFLWHVFSSDFGALAHLLKSSLGIGILAMPLAFRNGGLIFGMIGAVITGIICTHCVQMLVSNYYY